MWGHSAVLPRPSMWVHGQTGCLSAGADLRRKSCRVSTSARVCVEPRGGKLQVVRCARAGIMDGGSVVTPFCVSCVTVTVSLVNSM